jgi:hypothetical protein
VTKIVFIAPPGLLTGTGPSRRQRVDLCIQSAQSAALYSTLRGLLPAVNGERSNDLMKIDEDRIAQIQAPAGSSGSHTRTVLPCPRRTATCRQGGYYLR